MPSPIRCHRGPRSAVVRSVGRSHPEAPVRLHGAAGRSMSTSGGGVANALLSLLVVVLGSLVGQRLAERRSGDPQRGLLPAALIWLLVALPSLTQLAVPALLPLLRRDP